MTLGERIKQLRERAGDSQEILAQKLGVKTRGSINDYEKDRTQPSADKLLAISQLYNVTTDWLLTGKEGHNNIEEPAPKYSLEEAMKTNVTHIKVNFYKVIKHVNAGDPMFIYSNENFTGEMVPFDYEKKERCFVLTVSGDSMSSTGNKSIKEGDRVLIDMDAEILSGDVVVISLANGRELIKQLLSKDDEFVKLHSFNPNYPDMLIKAADIHVMYRAVRSASIMSL